MSSEVAKTPEQKIVDDGFDGFNDTVEGDDEGGQQASGGIIKGQLVRFSNEATYLLRDGDEMPNVELIGVDVLRVLQKWIEQKPIETRILAAGEKIPSVEALNATCPKSEWGEDFNGNEKGPWQFQYVVYLLDPNSMDRYSFPVGTVGGGIAVRELVEKTKWMRKFRGNRVYPVLRLDSVFMKTKYGGRQRPNFLVLRFVQLGNDQQPALAPPAAEAADVKTISEPSLAEQMGDEVPWNDSPDITVSKAPAASPSQPAQKPAAQKPAMTKKGMQKIAGRR